MQPKTLGKFSKNKLGENDSSIFLMRVERLFNYHKLSRNPKQVMYLILRC